MSNKKGVQHRFCFVLVFVFIFFSLFSLLNAQNYLPQTPQKKDTNIPKTAGFWSDYPDVPLATSITDNMSDPELLAQIFMFGWAGQEPSVLLTQWVEQRALGSVKVFGWNTQDTIQVAKSITLLQQKAAKTRFGIPLYVATDQEGGWIRHVKGDTSLTPGNLSIGAAGDCYDAFYSGYYINREIAALGINMNFAPTVDLFTNKNSSVIGPRSFGENALQAGILGAAFAKGSKQAGVIPTAKHFPGHGDTALDSHGKLPVITIDKDTFFNRELVPFMYLIKDDIPAIMSAHLSFPNIDPTGTPASLSSKFLGDILREGLGYKGLIITDDMMMNGATIFSGNMAGAYQMAIQAGNDIIISSTCAELNSALWQNNLSLMKTNPQFRQKVKTAAFRVILSKMQYFKHSLHADIYPDIKKIKQRVPDPEGKKFFLSQACRSITIQKAGSLFPLSAKEQTGENILLMGQFDEFFSEGKKRYKKAKYFKFNFDLGPNETQWIKDNIKNQLSGIDTIIMCVADDRSPQVLHAIEQYGKKIIIFSIMSPVPVLNDTKADTILLGYSYSPFTFNAMFGALAGEFTPKGILPLSYLGSAD